MDDEMTRNSAPIHDKVRHPLTIYQAVELFTQLSVPRSKRSVQRFCEQGHLDCVLIKGPRGDKFFINRESVEHYAEELRQIDVVGSIGTEPRDDVQQHDITRNSVPKHVTGTETVDRLAPAGEPKQGDSAAAIQRLRDENLNLRIDNRGKEQAISFLTAQMREKDQALQNLSYRLGAAETRVAQLEAPKVHDDTPRQSATEHAMDTTEAIVLAETPSSEPPRSAVREEPETEPRRSAFGRFFR